MKATLYYPVVSYDDSRFDYHGEISEQDYVSSLYNSFNQSNAVLSRLQGQNMTGSIQALRSMNGKINNNSKRIDNIYKYLPVEVVIRDSDGDDEKIDNIISYYQSGEPFVLIIKFPNKVGELDEDIDSDLKFWVRDTRKVNMHPKLNADEKFLSLPTRDMRVMFGENSYAVFESCKILEKYGSWEYAILVQKVTFTKKLDI